MSTTQTKVRSTEEALKLALKALESATPKYARQRKDQKELGGYLEYWKLSQYQRGDAITAIKEALSSPNGEAQPEPSTSAGPITPEMQAGPTAEQKASIVDAMKAQSEQRSVSEQLEPVACIGYWNQKTGAYYKPDQISASHQKLIEDGILRRCYTTPPQRKPLTDAQITALLVELCVPKCYEGVTETFTAVVRAIEAAHGIKE